jgi:uncharacterized protein (TIGR00255 family)
MRSMTGYGRASAALGQGTLTVQVSSVNRKGLDLSVRLPPDWESLETAVGEAVRKHVSRGKVHVDVEYAAAKGGAELGWSDEAVAAALGRLGLLAKAQGIDFRPDTALLWQVAQSQRAAREAPEVDDAAQAVVAALSEALRAFSAMRAKEGEALCVDFIERIAALRRHVDTVAQRAPQVAPAYRAQLLKRLRDAGLELDVTDERVLKEVALFADRSDISEEITRFRSHLDQLGTLIRSDEDIGRKADFILQELGREANTIGSKANDLEISRAVIEMKNELERVREQMANVE